MNEQQVNELLQSDFTKDSPEKTGINPAVYPVTIERIKECSQRLDRIRARLKEVYLRLYHLGKTAERLYSIAEDENPPFVQALAEMCEDTAEDIGLEIKNLIEEANYHPIKLDPFEGDGELDL